MKKWWKKLRQFSPLSASLLILAATIFGYTVSEPVLGEIIWPEMPIIEVVKAEETKKEESVSKTLTDETSELMLPEKPEPKEPIKNAEFHVTNWKDGSYEGSASGFGGTIRVQVTIGNGKIQSISVLSHAGETPSYYNRGKEIISRILEKQTPNVDTVSGATYTSGGIREAVKNALNQASGIRTEKSETETDKADETDKEEETQEPQIPDGKPADGTYEASAGCEQGRRFQYQVMIKAVFKKGILKKISMTTTDTGRNQRYIDAAWNVLKNSILKNQSGTVDVVSGATYTSKAIRAAYKMTYRQAVEAGGGTVEADEPDDPRENSFDKPMDTDEESAEGNVSGFGEDSAEESTSDFGESAVEESASGSGESSVEESASGSGGSSVEESASGSGESAVEESASGSGESAVEESASGSGESTVEENTSDSREGLVEESTSASGENATGQSTSGSRENPEEGSISISEENAAGKDTSVSGEDSAEKNTSASSESSTGQGASGSESGTKPSGPKDGTYHVTAYVNPDEAKKSSQKGQFYGYTISGTVKFKGGVLSSISNITVIYSSDIRDEYEDDVYYTSKAASGMPGKLKRANSADVDTVSGATCSSKAIIRLYQAAYKMATGR